MATSEDIRKGLEDYLLNGYGENPVNIFKDFVDAYKERTLRIEDGLKDVSDGLQAVAQAIESRKGSDRIGF